MNKLSKTFIVLFSVWLLIITGAEILTNIEIRAIKDNWPQYRNQKLYNQAEYIQKEFSLMEQVSFALLDQLVNQSSIIFDVARWSEHSRTKIFEELIHFNDSKEWGRGIALYNSKRECIAWNNCDPDISPALLNECLTGKRFSAISKSSKKVFVILCTFIPIPHPILQQNIGVAVAFLTLDKNYPLSTRYIQSNSFASRMLQQCDLQDIQIQYEQNSVAPHATEDVLVRSLLNLNGQSLGYISLTSLSFNIIIQRCQSDGIQTQKNATSILLIFFTIFSILGLRQIHWPPIVFCLSIIFLLLFLRYILFVLNFQALLFPKLWNSPEIFHSLVFWDWSDCLSNLLLTTFIVWAISHTFSLTCPYIPIRRMQQAKYSLLFLVVLIIPWVFQFLASFLDFLIHEIVRHSTIEIFNFVQTFPSSQSLAIYTTCFFLGLSIISLAHWIIFHLKQWEKISFRWVLLPVLLSFSLYFFHFLLLQHSKFLDYWVYPTLLFIASLLLSLAYPKRIEVRWVFVLLLASIMVYVSLSHACRLKIRTTIEDRSEEFQNELYLQTMELSLDVFEQNPEIIQALSDKKEDIAFLLWARSPLSERLDNFNIMVFLLEKTNPNQKKSLESHQFFSKSPHRFSLLSQFSLNMPNSDPQLSDIDPEHRQITENIPGYGNEGQNLLFFRGVLPIRKNNELVGVIALFIRYPQIGKVLPIPELFLKKNSVVAFPLLMASFEDGIMIHCNNPYFSKNVHLSDHIAQQAKQNSLWYEEKIDNRWYDNFYFTWVEQTRVPNSEEKDPNQFPILAKKRVGMIGYPLWSWLFDVFYYIQLFLFNFLLSATFYFLKNFLVWLWKRNHFSTRIILSFEHKLLVVFILISGIPVFIMGLVNQQRAVAQIWDNYRKVLTSYLENAEKTIREDTILPLLPEKVDYREKSSKSNQNISAFADDLFCRSWGERNKNMLNLYSATYHFDLESFPIVYATNRRELFKTELLSERISGKAFYHLILQRKDIYITLESISDYSFVVGYKTIKSSLDKRLAVGIISIPTIYQNAEVQLEIAEIIATIFTIYFIAFLVVVGMSVFLAYHITRPLASLTNAIQRVSQGELNFDLPVISQDEFGKVIEAFNQMTKDLQSSRQKLVQAEKDAAWREMSRQIAHEIKNPLTPMKLSAQHIQRAYHDQAKNFDKILEKGIHTIIDAIENLSKTASAFSEFAKFTKPNLGAYRLEPLLYDCFNLFLHTENIHFESKIEVLPEVITDPHQIKRVLINILTNAVQAIQKFPGKIQLFAYPTSDRKVCIQIRDNGVGIPESLQSRLFEPNFSTKTHGSGLGLAICKRAIIQMDGDIQIESQENQGTTVSIYLMAAKLSLKNDSI